MGVGVSGLRVDVGAGVWVEGSPCQGARPLDTHRHSWSAPFVQGWTATGDALENVARSNLVFQTKEAAIAFAGG